MMIESEGSGPCSIATATTRSAWPRHGGSSVRPTMPTPTAGRCFTTAPEAAHVCGFEIGMRCALGVRPPLEGTSDPTHRRAGLASRRPPRLARASFPRGGGAFFRTSDKASSGPGCAGAVQLLCGCGDLDLALLHCAGEFGCAFLYGLTGVLRGATRDLELFGGLGLLQCANLRIENLTSPIAAFAQRRNPSRHHGSLRLVEVSLLGSTLQRQTCGIN